jgi:hypothetical protein
VPRVVCGLCTATVKQRRRAPHLPASSPLAVRRLCGGMQRASSVRWAGWKVVGRNSRPDARTKGWGVAGFARAARSLTQCAASQGLRDLFELRSSSGPLVRRRGRGRVLCVWVLTRRSAQATRTDSSVCIWRLAAARQRGRAEPWVLGQRVRVTVCLLSTHTPRTPARHAPLPRHRAQREGSLSRRQGRAFVDARPAVTAARVRAE